MRPLVHPDKATLCLDLQARTAHTHTDLVLRLICMPAQSQRLDAHCPTVRASGSAGLGFSRATAGLTATETAPSVAIIMLADCNSSLFGNESSRRWRIFLPASTIQRRCRMWRRRQFADARGSLATTPRQPYCLVFWHLTRRSCSNLRICVSSLCDAGKLTRRGLTKLQSSLPATLLTLFARRQIRKSAKTR